MAGEDITTRKPFDLQEAVILLDVYLSYVVAGFSYSKAANIASHRLRELACKRGMTIDISFRSAQGIHGRLRRMCFVYQGQSNEPYVFAEAVDLYKNNRERYLRILNDFEHEDADDFLRATSHKKNKKKPSVCSDRNLAKNAATEPDIQDNWVRFDFANMKQFERTYPVYCIVNNDLLTGSNWVRILVALIEHEMARENQALDSLYGKPLLAGKNKRPFFMAEKRNGLNCARLSNGYWIYVNYSIPQLMRLIKALGQKCGYNSETLILYGCPKAVFVGHDESSGNNNEAVKKNSKIPTAIRSAILTHFPIGMHFDDSELSQIRRVSEMEIDEPLCKILTQEMFERRDGVFFLPEMVMPNQIAETMTRDVLALLKIYKLLDTDTLYNRYFRANTDTKIIRNSEDSADYLLFLLPGSIRIGKIGANKVVTTTDTTVDEAAAHLTNLLIEGIMEHNAASVDDLLSRIPTVNETLLRKLLSRQPDKVEVTTINGIVCCRLVNCW